MTKKQLFNEIKGYIFMLLGCVAYGASTSLFLAPPVLEESSWIVAGGISGLAVILSDLWSLFDTGVWIILLNVPILIAGLRMQGWKFIIRALITIVSLGVVTDLLGYIPFQSERGVLAALYGGICQGIGLGLFLRYEFSSGGTELLGRIISNVTKVIKIPLCVGILDAIIVLLGTIAVGNPNNMLYALIVIFLSTKISEWILVGGEKSKLCIIITDKGKEVSDTLLHNSPRGVTMLEGEGMYTHKDRDVLLTCVKKRQLNQLKQLVYNEDPNAFIIVNDSVEVRGKGFQALDEGLKKKAVAEAVGSKEKENEI
ncbi:MAG: YitT family protein [Clostridia bacterium]|nr:YitT family protein [Clostridia bacterium]